MILAIRLSLLSALLASSAAASAVVSFDFGPWTAGTSPQEVGKRVAENFVVRPHGNVNRPTPPKYIIYPEACAWYGALTFAQLTGDSDLTTRLVKRFEPLLNKQESHLVPPPIHVDLSVFAIVPLEIYIQNKDTRCLELGKGMADAQWQPVDAKYEKDYPNQYKQNLDATEMLVKGLSPQTRYWIDDMYMLPALQAQAFRATKDPVYLDRAAVEMAAYLDKLQRPNGLFYHSPEVPFFWGRGNGWVAAGMAELLRDLPTSHPQYARIMEGYRKMMEGLLNYQSADGMWRQLVDRPESWPETSGTAMFAFAFITGVKNGWLDRATYGVPARKAWLALVGFLDEKGNLREVCEGTNKKNDYDHYMQRQRYAGDLHGQAPMLWCASALLR